MSSTIQNTFDLQRFARAAEERDASTQLSMYVPQATVSIVDKNTQPSRPRVLKGTDEIRSWLEEMYGRDMTHLVGHTVSDDAGAAFTQACSYPDGTRVLCATVIELEQGLIARQSVVQVWDEA